MDMQQHAPSHTENKHQNPWSQENQELKAKLESQEAEVCLLSSQVSGIREELARRDQAQHAERLAREATIQELCVERNSLTGSLAAAQAEMLAMGRCNTELESRASQVEQVASTLPPALRTRPYPGESVMLRVHASRAASVRSHYSHGVYLPWPCFRSRTSRL